MRKLFGKRFHRIPVALVSVILAMVLIAGTVFAAYPFLSFVTAISVDEPMTGEYNLGGQYGGDSNWHPLGDEDSLTIDGSAGDVFTLKLRFLNYASHPLVINTEITGGGGNIDGKGFPNNAVIAGGSEGNPSEWVEFTVSVIIKGDAAPGDYNVRFRFTRDTAPPSPAMP